MPIKASAQVLRWSCKAWIINWSVADSAVGFLEPPVEFTKPLEDQTVEEEATATLECEVSRENAEVQWFRDGQEIRKTKKYEMIVDGGKRALLIHDCTLDDSRSYTCDSKDFKTSCFLSVERKCRGLVQVSSSEHCSAAKLPFLSLQHHRWSSPSPSMM